MSDYPDQPMCPNCVTPWKCNGPHMTAPSETPQTGKQAGSSIVVGSEFAQSQAECERLRHDIARHIQITTDQQQEIERLNKELHSAGIDYMGCMEDRKEYMRRTKEKEGEIERLRRAIGTR